MWVPGSSSSPTVTSAELFSHARTAAEPTSSWHRRVLRKQLSTACAIKCLGGSMQCKLWPRNDEDIAESRKRGLDLDQVLTINDLSGGTTCSLPLRGHRRRFFEGRPLRRSGNSYKFHGHEITKRHYPLVDSIHMPKKLSELSKVSGIEYSTV